MQWKSVNKNQQDQVFNMSLRDWTPHPNSSFFTKTAGCQNLVECCKIARPFLENVTKPALHDAQTPRLFFFWLFISCSFSSLLLPLFISFQFSLLPATQIVSLYRRSRQVKAPGYKAQIRGGKSQKQVKNWKRHAGREPFQFISSNT